MELAKYGEVGGIEFGGGVPSMRLYFVYVAAIAKCIPVNATIVQSAEGVPAKLTQENW